MRQDCDERSLMRRGYTGRCTIRRFQKSRRASLSKNGKGRKDAMNPQCWLCEGGWKADCKKRRLREKILRKVICCCRIRVRHSNWAKWTNWRKTTPERPCSMRADRKSVV